MSESPIALSPPLGSGRSHTDSGCSGKAMQAASPRMCPLLWHIRHVKSLWQSLTYWPGCKQLVQTAGFLSFLGCSLWHRRAVKPPTFTDVSRGLAVTSLWTKRLPVRKRLSLPSLFRTFSNIREEWRTQPSLTIADSISAPSQERGMSEIHSFVVGLSFPSCPLRMKGFLSYRDNAWPRRLIPSVGRRDRAGRDSG